MNKISTIFCLILIKNLLGNKEKDLILFSLRRFTWEGGASFGYLRI